MVEEQASLFFYLHDLVPGLTFKLNIVPGMCTSDDDWVLAVDACIDFHNQGKQREMAACQMERWVE